MEYAYIKAFSSLLFLIVITTLIVFAFLYMGRMFTRYEGYDPDFELYDFGPFCVGLVFATIFFIGIITLPNISPLVFKDGLETVWKYSFILSTTVLVNSTLILNFLYRRSERFNKDITYPFYKGLKRYLIVCGFVTILFIVSSFYGPFPVLCFNLYYFV